MLIKTAHNFFIVKESKRIELSNITSLRLVNIGNTPFEICGQTIMPSGTYAFLNDGSVTDFDKYIDFSSGNEAKAVVEFKQVIKQQCNN